MRQGKSFAARRNSQHLRQKRCTLELLLANFATVFDILAQIFRCERAFRLNQITGNERGTIAVEHFDLEGQLRPVSRVRAVLPKKSWRVRTPERIASRTEDSLKKAA
jgi:hypothetical protein